MKVVLDTNMLLAAIATHGLCRALVTLIFREHVVVLSERILGEVAKHYQEKFKATKRQADAIVATLRANSDIVEPAAVPLGTVRDKADRPVLGTAVAASATVIVTGDRELLDLGMFRGVALVSPREFYDRLRGRATRGLNGPPRNVPRLKRMKAPLGLTSEDDRRMTGGHGFMNGTSGRGGVFAHAADPR